MYSLDSIRHLHIEASSACNARCPLCPRNVFGYPHNLGYAETSLELSLIEKSLSAEFLSQIKHVLFNGNFGDFTANLEILDIIRYLRRCNADMKIEVSTNGSARNKEFWQQLGSIDKITVQFCLDGLEDTHVLYRQDTNWQRIIENAQTFMAAGGRAVWKMIRFDHNEHQKEACQQLSKELGFAGFVFNDHGRSNGPAFNRDGSLSHVLGEWNSFDNAKQTVEWLENNPTFKMPKSEPGSNIRCKALNDRSIYISAAGKVYPCCWLGFSPETYDKNWLGMLNKQIKPLVSNNDLRHNTLEQCLEWFESVESTWNSSNRLAQCDHNCSCKK